MNVKEFEGAKYVLQSDVETLINERLSRAVERARTAESALKTAEQERDQYKTSAESAGALGDQVAELRAELQKSEQRYDRHRTISGAGITDPDEVAVVEFAYDRAMAGVAKKDIVTLGDWLQGDAAKSHAVVGRLISNDGGGGQQGAEGGDANQGGNQGGQQGGDGGNQGGQQRQGLNLNGDVVNRQGVHPSLVEKWQSGELSPAEYAANREALMTHHRSQG